MEQKWGVFKIDQIEELTIAKVEQAVQIKNTHTGAVPARQIKHNKRILLETLYKKPPTRLIAGETDNNTIG